jgi:hypothetical protein
MRLDRVIVIFAAFDNRVKALMEKDKGVYGHIHLQTLIHT